MNATERSEAILVSCEALVVGRAGRALLPPLDLTIRRGELWVVLGRNGAGKTTWARTLLGLERAVAGRVTIPPGVRRTYLAQQRELDAAYPLRVRDVVGFGLERGLGGATRIGFREGYLVVALTWIAAALFGALPFVLSGDGIDRKLYDHVNAYTGETGGDGVVRLAAANLDSTHVVLAQPALVPGEPLPAARRRLKGLRLAATTHSAPCAFKIVPGVSRIQPATWFRVGKSRSWRVASRSTPYSWRTAAKTSACLTVSTPRSASRSRSGSSSSGG